MQKLEGGAKASPSIQRLVCGGPPRQMLHLDLVDQDWGVASMQRHQEVSCAKLELFKLAGQGAVTSRKVTGLTSL